MPIAVTGSVATDHLMTFPGRFADQLLPEHLQKLSLSFLVDRLEVHRGGVAANIAYGMGLLGLRPVLIAAVGDDFADYRAWLDRHGVDTASVRVSELHHTARFVCTTDTEQCQIASFYPGAMSEAREIELRPVADRVGGFELVVVSPNDPLAMARHTADARAAGIPFAADPSQQLAFLEGPAIRDLVEGAAYLFTNSYEAALIEDKTGWSAEEILARVEVRVTTLGAAGARIDRQGEEPVVVPVVPEACKADPTGVGDAFRAGFISARSWGLSLARSAQLGSLLATLALETVGTQEYSLERASVLSRLGDAYGQECAEEIAPHLR